MQDAGRAKRLERLSTIEVEGVVVPVAVGVRARLLGLAGLDLDEAGPGLLIPRCRSVHTFGMRFALDLVFLDGAGRPLAAHAAVPPRRLVGCRGAAAVLELPAAGIGAGPCPSGARSGRFARQGGEREDRPPV